jgi:hypothetical protein
MSVLIQLYKILLSKGRQKNSDYQQDNISEVSMVYDDDDDDDDTKFMTSTTANDEM